MENVKTDSPETQNRREVVRNLGRFAAYAAPFTIMAMSSKVQGATSYGPGPKAAAAQANNKR